MYKLIPILFILIISGCQTFKEKPEDIHYGMVSQMKTTAWEDNDGKLHIVHPRKGKVTYKNGNKELTVDNKSENIIEQIKQIMILKKT